MWRGGRCAARDGAGVREGGWIARLCVTPSFPPPLLSRGASRYKKRGRSCQQPFSPLSLKGIERDAGRGRWEKTQTKPNITLPLSFFAALQSGAPAPVAPFSASRPRPWASPPHWWRRWEVCGSEEGEAPRVTGPHAAACALRWHAPPLSTPPTTRAVEENNWTRVSRRAGSGAEGGRRHFFRRPSFLLAPFFPTFPPPPSFRQATSSPTTTQR